MAGLASLVLADARFPGGGHVHSGGLEEAVERGLVSDVESLSGFLRGRLRTAGRVAACFAAAAAHHASRSPAPEPAPEPDSRSFGPVTPSQIPWVRAGVEATQEVRRGGRGVWGVLDAELEARTPSAAQREASRAQGRAALRAVRAAWPSPVLDALTSAHRSPHHPLLAGAVIGHAGEEPAAAARCVGYLALTGPASAAVRLLGLDPFAVNAAVVALGPDLDALTGEADALARGDVADLPAPGAPVLDLMAEAHVHHHRERVRLFAS